MFGPCEECGRSDVVVRYGVCFECQQLVEREDPFPAREVEFQDLANRPGQLLPRVKVVSPISCSWTSEARL